MAIFQEKKISFGAINNGIRYEKGDIPDAETFNAPIEASFWAQEKAKEAETKATAALDKVQGALGSSSAFSLLDAYPVGSIYITVSPTDPAGLFGGEWEQIAGRFLIGSGSALDNSMSTFGELNDNGYVFYTGQSGGQFRHKLTVEEMPEHSHSMLYYYYTEQGGNAAYGSSGLGNSASGKATGETGGDGLHNIMPPFYVVNMWRRTA